MTSRSRAWFLTLCVLASFGLSSLPSCTDQCEVTKTGNPSNSCVPASPLVNNLAQECGIDVDCEAAGIAEGNTAISGVQSIDTYFASVVRFQTEADRLSAALNAELAALRAAFGIDAGADLAAELRERIDASVDGELLVRAGAPSCASDVGAVLAAGARCQTEAEVDPSVELHCAGRCELPLDRVLECDGSTELACTYSAAASPCQGECTGRCASDEASARACPGICRGTCDGSCSLYSDATATQCGGRCDGMCTGSCEFELPEGGVCDGACSGECTLASPDGRCDGASSASCRGAPDATVPCAGRCEGVLLVPQTKIECQAVADAEARLTLQCTPPRVAIDYRLRSDLDPEASARFELGMRILQERLPSLLVTLARAKQAATVGADLGADAGSRVKAAAESVKGDVNLRVQFGAICAVRDAARIPAAIAPATSRLSTAVADSLAVTRALGMP